LLLLTCAAHPSKYPSIEFGPLRRGAVFHIKQDYPAMKTFSATPADIDKKWILIDADMNKKNTRS